MGSILEIHDIEKVYPNGVVANRGVSFSVEEQSIHALVGENGAGKTTLMKIVFGMEKAQRGRIVFRGQEVQIKNSLEAIKLGIGMVHQHFMLAPELTVAENMVLGMEPRARKIFFDKQQAYHITEEISKRYGLAISPDKLIKDLPVGAKQRVEILKALSRNAELLILDEPTSVLTPQETEVLFKTLLNLKSDGKTIIFISHKLREVKQIADRITVMRDGSVIATKAADELSEQELACLMVGREISFDRISPPTQLGEPLLEVKNLQYTNEDGLVMVKNVSFDLRQGEIVGLAGIEGNGQNELSEIITGFRRADAGSLRLCGKEVLSLNPRELRERGIAYIPEDRMKEGVAEKATIEENLIVDRYNKENFSQGIRLNWPYITKFSQDLMQRFQILATSTKAWVSSLSGGNIQKVVVARELSSSPQVIIANQPTRGIDVGSAEMVHGLLQEARDAGKGIFLVSADIDELLKMSTRILVIYGGEIVAVFDVVDSLTGKDLGPYMLGLEKQGTNHGKSYSEVL